MKPKKKTAKNSSRATGKWVKRDATTGQFIEAALNDGRYRARTIEGIAKVAKVSAKEVVHTIKTDSALREKVKIYPRKSKDGRILLTTKDRFSKEASIKDKFIEIFSTKLPEIDDE